MANTYTQIHIQAIFAPKFRHASLDREWRPELFRYITGILQAHGHKMLQINGMEDHIHIFFGCRPTQSLSELMKEIKESSSSWINRNKLTKNKFRWQEGYGAFSYSKSQVQDVIKYIENQEIHHYKQSFLEEYKLLLEDFGIDYNDGFIFKPLI